MAYGHASGLGRPVRVPGTGIRGARLGIPCQNDFSVAYVAANSNTELPWYYRLAAIWGAHEGSLLLWVTMLAGWSLAVAAASAARCRNDVAACVLAVMGMDQRGLSACSHWGLPTRSNGCFQRPPRAVI